jgi:large repetitive protein
VSSSQTGKSFTNTISITASNVTLTRCKITIPASAPWAVGIPGGLTGIRLQNCTIIGAGTASTGAGVYGVYIQGDSGVTIDSCDFSELGQSVALNGGQVTITNNWFHDMGSGPGTHYEHVYYGGAAKGASDFFLLIRGNNFNNQINQTAAVYIENYFGAVSNVTIDTNLLIGGDYTVYVEGNQNPNNITNVSVTNNALGIGTFGYINANPGLAPIYQVTVSGNYDWKTLAPVTAVQDPH